MKGDRGLGEPIESSKVVCGMDILIESTKRFETDLANLSTADRTLTIEKINDCASLFPTHKADGYRKLRRIQIPPN
jgi:hypothetical protein